MYSNVEFFFFQAEDGIGVLRMSRGLGDVYTRQVLFLVLPASTPMTIFIALTFVVGI
ncbi:hypothetical protein JSCD13_36170 [Clostridioides difficile]|nr:hypothetical protein JSCD13_36170 [Clostridioides difficile]